MKSLEDAATLDRLYKYTINLLIGALVLGKAAEFLETRIEGVSGVVFLPFGIMLTLSGIFALGILWIFIFTKLRKQ